MAANTGHLFNNKAYANLRQSVDNDDVSFLVNTGDTNGFLGNWESGKHLVAVVTDAVKNLEVIKITNINGGTDTFTVLRGQDGSVSRAWPVGSLVVQRLCAANLDQFLPREYREGSYNPHGVLSGVYTGEKFYQTGPSECQRRWFVNHGGTNWKLLAGELCGAEYYDGDGFVISPLTLTPDEDVDKGLWSPAGALPDYFDKVNQYDAPVDTEYVFYDFPGSTLKLGFDEHAGLSVTFELLLNIRCACSSPGPGGGKMDVSFWVGAVQKGPTLTIGSGEDAEWPGGAGPAFGNIADLQFAPVTLSVADLDALEIHFDVTTFGVTCYISEIKVEGN